MQPISKIPEQKITKYLRLLVALFFIWYFLSSALDPTTWHFIDNVDLIFHEAGHWIFIFFGDFVASLGGTINQLLIPFVLVVYFFIKRELFSSMILLMWLGYNFVNVSVYMADAVVMQLPLLGGDNVGHDWNNIFETLGLLENTQLLATITRSVGMFIIIAGAVLAVKYAMKDRGVSNE
jgi:hypothetical protein